MIEIDRIERLSSRSRWLVLKVVQIIMLRILCIAHSGEKVRHRDRIERTVSS